jgi:hypothetical protein
MAFPVIAAEAAAAVVLVLDVQHDRGAGGPGPRVDRIGVGHDHVGALGLEAADLVGLLDEAAVIAVDTEPSMIIPLPKLSWA